jgi:Tfp pilus assembly protein PilN
VITRLEMNRTGQVRVLDEIAARIPERMWLEELTLKDQSLSIKGVSIDAEIVAEFLTAMSASPMFRNVELDGTAVKEDGELKLNVFSVRCQVGGEIQNPAAPAAGARK